MNATKRAQALHTRAPRAARWKIQSFSAWLRAFARVNPETQASHAWAVLLRGGDLARGERVRRVSGRVHGGGLLVFTVTMKRTL